MNTRNLYKFLGYGPPRSPSMFIGLEEYTPLATLEENHFRRFDSVQTPYADKDRLRQSWAAAG